MNIVEVASSDARFSTLVLAVKTAGLVETLSSEGPFTVFAPTNEAFEALGKETLDAVLADKAKLTSILTYHVAPQKLDAATVLAQTSITTVQGQELKVTSAPTPKVNDADIIATDILAENGVIHAINKVLLPE